MKKWFIFILVAAIASFSAGCGLYKKPTLRSSEDGITATNGQSMIGYNTNGDSGVPLSMREILILADFETRPFQNNLGGGYGAWDKDPTDPTQGCKIRLVSSGRDGNGECIQLKYSVDSPNPAYNGFWMKLNGKDFMGYKKLVFWIKGDIKDKYTRRFKIELKDMRNTSPYYVTDVQDKWTEVTIPFDEFYMINDWTRMSEFTIVFEDSQATEKKGTIYIDDIYVSK